VVRDRQTEKWLKPRNPVHERPAQSGVNCLEGASFATVDSKFPSGNASDLGDNAPFSPQGRLGSILLGVHGVQNVPEFVPNGGISIFCPASTVVPFLKMKTLGHGGG